MKKLDFEVQKLFPRSLCLLQKFRFSKLTKHKYTFPVSSFQDVPVSNIYKLNTHILPKLLNKNQNGLIRIRFIVNCEGKAGRFRVLQSDYSYKEKEFNKEIVSQLLSITKQINNWEVLYKQENAVDYYMYLIFKITDGQLTEILP